MRVASDRECSRKNGHVCHQCQDQLFAPVRRGNHGNVSCKHYPACDYDIRDQKNLTDRQENTVDNIVDRLGFFHCIDE